MDYTEMEMMLQELLQDPMYQQLFWITFLITLAVMLAFWVVMYILQGIGVRRLSAAAGLKTPALAFVPILRWMMLGRLAELQLPQERVPRKSFPFSVHLPILMTLRSLLNVAYSAYFSYDMFVTPDVASPDRLARVMNGVSIAYTVIDVITTVLLLMALFRIFLLIGNSSPMILTILCALIEFCLPVLLFVFRKNAVAPQPMSEERKNGNGDNGDDDSGFYYDNH